MNKEFLYEPAEDSFLLEKFVKAYAVGRVLDMGTGSGIQALAAAQQEDVRSVLALDIQKEVIAYCKKTVVNKKITWVQSDLFSSLKKNKTFDTIIFNPPYLPADEKDPHPALDGGKKGYETLLNFIEQAPDFLEKEGIIFIVFSSITKKDLVDEALRNKMLDVELLEKQHVSFEDLYIYKITKSALLKDLHDRGISAISYLSRGKRGKVFVGAYKKKKVAIKIKNPSSDAIGKIEHEAFMLRRLEQHDLAPKALFFTKDYLVSEYIDGKLIGDFLRSSSLAKTQIVFRKLFLQMALLDSLRIMKEEMHHPHKHVFVTTTGKIMHIDFERAHFSEHPGNVTQLCQFVTSSAIAPLLEKKKLKIDKETMILLAKEYKRAQGNNRQAVLKEIMKQLR